MTDEQIENWRKVLSITVGPYAFIMPKEDVQKMKNKFQSLAEKQDFGEF